MKVASKYAGGGLVFSVANKKDFLAELEDDFGLGMSDGGELPFVTIRTKLGHKYTMREEFTYVTAHVQPMRQWWRVLILSRCLGFRRDGQSLERFVDDYFAGRLKGYVKSEPVPERNTAAVKVDSSPPLWHLTHWVLLHDFWPFTLSVTSDPCLVLQVVVAESFDDIINNSEKDVLIQFYSPSCPHCKKLEPIYRELANMVGSSSSLVNALPMGPHDLLLWTAASCWFWESDLKTSSVCYSAAFRSKNYHCQDECSW